MPSGEATQLPSISEWWDSKLWTKRSPYCTCMVSQKYKHRSKGRCAAVSEPVEGILRKCGRIQIVRYVQGQGRAMLQNFSRGRLHRVKASYNTYWPGTDHITCQCSSRIQKQSFQALQFFGAKGALKCGKIDQGALALFLVRIVGCARATVKEQKIGTQWFTKCHDRLKHLLKLSNDI